MASSDIKYDMDILSSILKLISTNGIDYFNLGLDKEVLTEAFEKLIPRDENGNLLVNYYISRSFFSQAPARYNSIGNVIEVETFQLFCFINEIVKKLSKRYNIERADVFISYMVLFTILHELEHVSQFNIGNGKEFCPYKQVVFGYKTMISLFDKYNVAPSMVRKYKCLKLSYPIERNANVEATAIMCDLATYNEDDDIFNSFNALRNQYIFNGYRKDTKGSFYHFLKDFKFKDELAEFQRIANYEEVPLEDRIRYGLEIPKEVRAQIRTRSKSKVA